jgi:hypothetical protein
MNRYRVFAGLIFAATLSSCQESTAVDDLWTPPVANVAQVRFFHFGVNAPGVNFYGNTSKLTAISSATGVEATTGTVYGGVGNGGFYSLVTPGAFTLTGKIAATVDKDLTIASVAATLDSAKTYSFYMCGFYNAGGKTSDAFVIEDVFGSTIDFSTAYVRFVHVISNAAPMTLYAKNTTTLAEVPVGVEVAYKAATAFVPIPAGVYDLGTRFNGVGTNAVSRTAVSFVAGKVYTIGARGDITVVSTTATNRPFLDNTANR